MKKKTQTDIATTKIITYLFVLWGGRGSGDGGVTGDRDESRDTTISSLSTGDLEDGTVKMDKKLIYINDIITKYWY